MVPQCPQRELRALCYALCVRAGSGRPCSRFRWKAWWRIANAASSRPMQGCWIWLSCDSPIPAGQEGPPSSRSGGLAQAVFVMRCLARESQLQPVPGTPHEGHGNTEVEETGRKLIAERIRVVRVQVPSSAGAHFCNKLHDSATMLATLSRILRPCWRRCCDALLHTDDHLALSVRLCMYAMQVPSRMIGDPGPPACDASSPCPRGFDGECSSAGPGTKARPSASTQTAEACG